MIRDQMVTAFEIKMDKHELLRIVNKNREAHVDTFKKALEQYRVEIVEYLNQRLNDIRDGKWIKHHIDLPIPESHEEDYDRVIGMLMLHQGDTIELNESMYRNYVEDQWSWSHAFALNSTVYAGRASG